VTSRERQLATIARKPTDRISLDVICIEIIPALAEYLGVAPEGVYDRLGIDGRIVAAPFIGAAPAHGVDAWAAGAWEDYGTAHNYPLANASVADVERHPWPDPADHDYAGAAAAAAAIGATYAVRGPYWQPLFCRVCSLMGMEEALAKLLTEPAVFEAALEAVFERTLAYCERLLDACGDALPILCLGDDFATQRGLLMAPQQWRRFLKPRFGRLFAAGKQRGKAVWFHSCGDVTAILPDLIDIGVDVWETVQLHTLPMAPATLKREFGRHLTFFGGVNTQRLPFATPAEVRAEVRACIEVLGEGGGYICGPDHHIKPDVPPANAAALFDEALEVTQDGAAPGHC
jgi:uroporphyrinogen decarboxylase